jgi:hypothetical protein
MTASEPWWRTVTPAELRSASSKVAQFLASQETATPGDTEAFARALALRQLFGDGEAVSDAMRRAEAMRLPHGEAIAQGLARCLALLMPQQTTPEWQKGLHRIQLTLDILRADNLAGGMAKGLESNITVRKPIDPGRWKL